MKKIFLSPTWLIYPTLFSLFALISVAAAGSNGTIILKSGERYDNITYSVDKIYKVIKATLEDSGEEKNFSFHVIDKILDEDGSDITSKVLGENRVPKEKEPWLSENSEVFRRSRTKMWNAILELGGNYSNLMGHYYEGIKPGFGIGGAVHIALDPQLVLGFSYGRSWMEGEDLFYDDDPEYEILQQEWTFGTGRYLMSVEYFDLIDKMENKLNMYFLGAGLGVIKHISTLKLTVREDSTGDIGSLDDTYKENKFILNFKGGIVREITKEVGINFSASFDIVVLGRENPYDMNSKMMYSSIVDVRAGLCYFIR